MSQQVNGVAGLELVGVAASYGRAPVVRGVSFAVAPGELLAVLGPSGCGKTTLLRVVAGLHRADAGTVSVGGRTVVDGRGGEVPTERRRVGLVPQEGALFPHLTVGENIAYGLRARGLRTFTAQERGRRRAAVAAMLDLVGLQGRGGHRPSQLSGGQQQRVALARALAPQPDIVLLDEPFSALDAGLRAHLGAEVRRLLRAQHMTSVLVTHDQNEALGMADRVAVLLGGRVAQLGTPEEVYHRPATVQVGEFVGESVTLPAVAEPGAAVAATLLGPLPLHAPAPARSGTVLVRPEQITLRPGRDTGFTVADISFGGALATVTVAGPPGGPDIRVTCVGSPEVRPGDTVELGLRSAVPFYRDGGGTAAADQADGALRVG